MIEIVIDRQRTEVHRAIVAFVAWRSYSMTNPWWIEGMRIEAPQLAEWRLQAENIAARLDHAIQSPHRRTWWASLLDLPQVPRIELEVKRRRGRSVVKVKISDHPDSTKLAAELQTYLLSDRAYDAEGLSNCPACGAPITNVIARYCGRCGRQLVDTKAEVQRLSPAVAAVREPPESTFPEWSPSPAAAATRESATAAAQPLAEPDEIVEPLDDIQAAQDAGVAETPTEAGETEAPAARDEIEEDRDSLDAREPDTKSPAAIGEGVEIEPPDDGPVHEAVAEADDDAEPPRRALAEED